MTIQRRNYLVTGGSQGVGEAIVAKLAKETAGQIAIVGRDSDKGYESARRLSTHDCKVHFLQCDLGDAKATFEVFSRAENKLGRIDGLVNSAGLTNRGSIAQGTLADWDMVFAVNARAPFQLMQAQIQHALNRGIAASIVNILSMNAFCGRPNLALYAASKAAVMTLTRNAAQTHMSDRIRVNGIAMGWAATPSEIAVQMATENRDEAGIRALAATLPLGRLLTVQEVANSAAFLLSDESGLMTGNILELEQWVRGAPPPR